MSQPQPLGPFKLVTVNIAPERARTIIGRVVEAVKDQYTIVHAANVEGGPLQFPVSYHRLGADAALPPTAIKDVAATVAEVKPDFLVRLLS